MLKKNKVLVLLTIVSMTIGYFFGGGLIKPISDQELSQMSSVNSELIDKATDYSNYNKNSKGEDYISPNEVEFDLEKGYRTNDLSKDTQDGFKELIRKNVKQNHSGDGVTMVAVYQTDYEGDGVFKIQIYKTYDTGDNELETITVNVSPLIGNIDSLDMDEKEEKKKESTWKKNWVEEDITKKQNSKSNKSDVAIQKAYAFAKRYGYSVDRIEDFGNGQVMLLYSIPRTGESRGEYFYY